MKRPILLISLFALLAFAGFYGAWPAWSGYRIRAAIENQDVALLESKIEFPSVRAALKPTVTAEVNRQVELRLKDAGPLGALIGSQLKGETAGRLVDRAIESAVTAESVIRIAHEGKSMREAIENVLASQMGGALGGVLGKMTQRRQGSGNEPKESPQPDASGNAKGEPGQAKRRFGLANVKRVSINGPLSFSVGVARKADAAEPDVTAEMRFTGFDWKVVSLIPRLEAGQ